MTKKCWHCGGNHYTGDHEHPKPPAINWKPKVKEVPTDKEGFIYHAYVIYLAKDFEEELVVGKFKHKKYATNFAEICSNDFNKKGFSPKDLK